MVRRIVASEKGGECQEALRGEHEPRVRVFGRDSTNPSIPVRVTLLCVFGCLEKHPPSGRFALSDP